MNDYLRDFAIVDPDVFAKEVVRAMTAEEEDGSSMLSDFFDTAMEDAVNDGADGIDDANPSIRSGTFSPLETWAVTPTEAP